MRKLKLAAVTVTYKTPPHLIKRLKHEFVKNKVSAHLCVIDNTHNNRGFAHGVNRGMKRLFKEGYDVVLVCNPDIYNLVCTETNILKASMKFDIFGGVMLQNSIRYYGGFLDYWTMAGGLSSRTISDMYFPCDFVSGSFMCITKRAFDTIGCLPENYFMYYEDVAFCRTALQQGLRVGISRALTYSHEETSRGNDLKNYYLAFNRLSFLFSEGSLVKKLRELIRTPFVICRLFASGAKKNSLQLQAYRDFFYGKKVPHQF
jgi:GT2 family glycosyltransferase